MDTLLEKGLTPLSVEEFKEIVQQDNVTILDSRTAHVFTEAYVPGSVNIGLEGNFTEWAGKILPRHHRLVLVAETGKERETVEQLFAAGFTKFEGYLEGGLEAWQDAGEIADLIINVEADEVAMDIPFDKNLVIVDVRKPVEFADGHVQGAINIPLSDLTDPLTIATFSDTDNLYVHCGGGYRSVIAASLIKQQGLHNLRNIVGGYTALKNEEKIKTAKSTEMLN